METAEEGGAAAISNPSSYCGSGTGGKVRRKTVRGQATPYDRPPTTRRGIRHYSGGWLSKVFVGPARRLLLHGVNRVFASVLGKRFPDPARQRQPGVSTCLRDATQRQVLNGEDTREQLVEDACGHLDNGSMSNNTADLEQLLKQNTFTRPQIVRLTEILQYKAAEVSSDAAFKESAENAVDFGGRGQISSPSGENTKEIQLSASISTPIRQSKVPGDDTDSLVKIARAYMGTRSSKPFPSALGFHHHHGREDMRHSIKGSFAYKSLAIPYAKNKSSATTIVENGSTLNSRRRSSIYNIARTPCSRDNSIFKNFKRKISVLDGQPGSIGPIRRLRQKSNLLAPRIPHVISGDARSHAEQKSDLMGEVSTNDSGNVVLNGNNNDPISNYPHVPSQSSEAATKILQQLNELSPNEKSSAFKSHVGLEKSKLQLTAKNPDEMSGDLSPDLHDSLKKPDEGSAPKGSMHPPEAKCNRRNGNYSVNTTSSLCGTTNSNSSGNGYLESSQKKSAFRISAREDSVELDDDTLDPSSKPVIEKPGAAESSAAINKALTSKETDYIANEFQTDLALPKGRNASKAFESSTSKVSEIGERGSVSLREMVRPAVDSLQEAPHISIEKQNKANGSSQAFSFSSKVNGNPPTLPPCAMEESAHKMECSTSLTVGLQLSGTRDNKLEVKETSHLSDARAGDANGNSSTTLAANESPFCLHLSAAASFSSDTAQKSVGTSFLNFSITSAANLVPSSASKSFGDSVSVPTASSLRSSGNLLAVSAEPTTAISVTPDYGPKARTQQFSGSISEPLSWLPEAGPAPASKAFSNFSQSGQTNLKGSIFGDPYKNPEWGNGTIANKGSVFASSASTSDTSAAVHGNSQASANSQADGSTATRKENESGLGLSSSSTARIGPHGGTFTFSSSSTTGSSIDKITPSSSFPPGSSVFATINTSGSFRSSSSSIFGGSCFSSAATSSAINSSSSCSASSNTFASSSRNPNPPVIGTTFPFVASSTPSAPLNSATSVFGSSATASSSPNFSFPSNSFSIPSSSLAFSHPTFGKPISTVADTSSVHNDQKKAEDITAEDPFQPSASALPVFSQPSVPLSASPLPFGSNAPSQANPFFSCGQESQVPPQTSGSPEFNESGGGFSTASGAPGKPRRTVRKVRNRKKT